MPHSDSTPLDAHTIEVKMTEIPLWEADMEAALLTRVFECRDFAESMHFVQAVADLAEKHNHHPDILISYKTVTLALITHDAGGITEKDIMLASHIDALPEAKSADKNKPR